MQFQPILNFQSRFFSFTVKVFHPRIPTHTSFTMPPTPRSPTSPAISISFPVSPSSSSYVSLLPLHLHLYFLSHHSLSFSKVPFPSVLYVTNHFLCAIIPSLSLFRHSFFSSSLSPLCPLHSLCHHSPPFYRSPFTFSLP